MKTVRRYGRVTSWYSEPVTTSRLSLVTVPNSSTPVSSGTNVALPTPHSCASSRRWKLGYVAVFAMRTTDADWPHTAMGPTPPMAGLISADLVMKDSPLSRVDLESWFLETSNDARSW